MQDPYSTLGVSKDASDLEIKKAYRKLAKQFHPDANAGDKTKAEHFKKVSDAYEKIQNSESRRMYEQEKAFGGSGQAGGRGGNGGHPFGGGQYYSSHDVDPEILEKLFAGLGGFGKTRQSKKSQKQDVVAAIKIPFWDAVLGVKKIITLSSGINLEVEIPTGIKSGQKIRLKNMASRVSAELTGDLLLEVEVMDDAKAYRKENDLYVVMDVDLISAINGREYLFETPIGNFKVALSEFTDSGKKYRFKNKGINGGDLYGVVNLVMPQNKEELVKLKKGFEEFATAA